MERLLLHHVAFVLCLAATVLAGVINNAPPSGISALQAWPSSSIAYKWNGQDIHDWMKLREAMKQISDDTGKCITFLDVSRNNSFTGHFLSIGPKNASAPANEPCFTHNGFLNSTEEGQGQRIVAFRTPTKGKSSDVACLDSKRDTMRLLTNALGVLNEWMKPTRDQYVKFVQNRNQYVKPSLRYLDLFGWNNTYTPDEALDVTPNMFDAHSITMVSPRQFAANKSEPVFELHGGLQAGWLPRLSFYDCLTLQYLYNCPYHLCEDPYADGTVDPELLKESSTTSSATNTTAAGTDDYAAFMLLV